MKKALIATALTAALALCVLSCDNSGADSESSEYTGYDSISAVTDASSGSQTEANAPDSSNDTAQIPVNEDEIADFMPPEATELLFCHQIFSSPVYLLSYRTEPKSVCVYYTADSGESYEKLDINLGGATGYDAAEAVCATGGAGSGEARFYVELTRGGKIEYLEFDNYDYTDENDWLDFGYGHTATEEELILLYGLTGADIKFPCVNAPSVAADISSLGTLGLPDDDVRISYIKAFLRGDTAELERLCGVGQGMYDMYKSVRLNRFVAFTDSYPSDGTVRVNFCFDPSESDVDSFIPSTWNEFVVDESPMTGAYIYGAEEDDIDSDAARELRSMLGSVYFCAIPEDDDMENSYRWCLTEYICYELGDTVAHSAGEVSAYAEKYFGISGFTPDELHYDGEGYRTLPHGGLFRYFTITDSAAEGDATTLTVQYYADCSKTVKSHLFSYTMKKIDGVWAYTGSEELSHSEYEPLQWSV